MGHAPDRGLYRTRDQRHGWSRDRDPRVIRLTIALPNLPPTDRFAHPAEGRQPIPDALALTVALAVALTLAVAVGLGLGHAVGHGRLQIRPEVCGRTV